MLASYVLRIVCLLGWFETDSLSPGWPLSHYVAKVDLELPECLVFTSMLLQLYDF